MNTKQLNLTSENINPLEASNMIGSLIKDKINSYKLEKLSKWEANNSFNEDSICQKISLLEIEMIKIKEVINTAEKKNCKLSLTGSWELKLVD